ncbi:hypothetical protein AA313_de0205883 [Arthrobotrys entomopaga]|nr:hypothetical protein AA313_de0205883 [Arthrobotrys entomopaga]
MSIADAPPIGARSRVLQNYGLFAPQPTNWSGQIPDLKPGQMQVFSYFQPSLAAGEYTITASQAIKVDNQHTTLPAVGQYTTQRFRVDGPRFRLPDNTIHDFYPPSGASVEGNNLPHIVFNDPHLPWEQNFVPPTSTPLRDGTYPPWMAVFAFTPEELSQGPKDLQLEAAADTQIVSTTVAEMRTWSTKDCYVPPLDLDAPGVEAVNSIIIDSALFQALILDSSGKSVDASKYQYFAHVRSVNLANASDTTSASNAAYSVLFSSRTAQTFPQTTRGVIAHVVSLEGWQSSKLSDVALKRYVALTSLFSWTYNAVAPVKTSFVDVMRNLGKAPTYKTGQTTSAEDWYTDDRMLRAPSTLIGKLAENNKLPLKLSKCLSARLTDGYTITNYIVQTGEKTIALYRGPLSPVPVPAFKFGDKKSSADGSVSSFYGSDLQIVDQDLGMLDNSYSCAWELGKLLAFASREYSTAYSKLRNQIVNASVERTRQRLSPTAILGDRITMASNVDTWLTGLYNLLQSTSEHDDKQTNLSKWFRADPIYGRTFSMDCGAENFIEKLAIETTEISKKFASTASYNIRDRVGDVENDGTEDPIYNELNAPASPEYATVLKFLMDMKFFADVPMCYLLPDPSFLPEESMKFFYIDKNWIDCMIDGALSIANTFNVKNRDVVKDAIKKALAKYEATIIDPVKAPYPPQIPTFGLFLRSVAVSTWANLEISAPYPSAEVQNKRLEIVKMQKLSEDTLFILFDRKPEDNSQPGPVPILQRFSISIPSHQQTFQLTADGNLKKDGLEMDYVKIDPAIQDTVENQLWPSVNREPGKPFAFHPTDPEDRIYDWDTRMINTCAMVKWFGDPRLLAVGPGENQFQKVSPVVVALQLGEKKFILDIQKLRSNEPIPPRKARSPNQNDISMNQQAQRSAIHETSILAQSDATDSTGSRSAGTISTSKDYSGTYAKATFEQLSRGNKNCFLRHSVYPQNILPFPLTSTELPPEPTGQSIIDPPEEIQDLDILETDEVEERSKMTKQQPVRIEFRRVGTKTTLSDLSCEIPIVAGPLRKIDTDLPRHIDLCCVLTALGKPEARHRIMDMVMIFPMSTTQNGRQNLPFLTSRYTGPGPYCTNARLSVTIDRNYPIYDDDGQQSKAPYLILRLRPKDRSDGAAFNLALAGPTAIILPKLATDSTVAGVSSIYISWRYRLSERALLCKSKSARQLVDILFVPVL